VLEGAYDYMISRGMKPEKFLFVPNGVNIKDEQNPEKLPQHHINVIERCRKQGCFIVGYAGRIGISNALHSLIGAIARCTDSKIVAVILGDGSHVNSLKKVAERLKISDRIFFLDSVRKSQVNDFLARIDVAYIGLQKQPLFRFGVSPTKLNDYMLAAKPIIYGIDAPGDMVEKSGAGISCRAENEDDIKKAIERIRALEPQERLKMGKRGREWVIANRDYRVLSQRFLNGIRKDRCNGRQK
jgi:glycosyltransferase involved in cell wall biosynthesis